MKMPTADEIRLAAGELTAGEMRTVKAVLQWFINTRCNEADGKAIAACSAMVKWCDRNDWGAVPKNLEQQMRAAIDAAMRQSAPEERK